MQSHIAAAANQRRRVSGEAVERRAGAGGGRCGGAARSRLGLGGAAKSNMERPAACKRLAAACGLCCLPSIVEAVIRGHPLRQRAAACVPLISMRILCFQDMLERMPLQGQLSCGREPFMLLLVRKCACAWFVHALAP